MTTLPQDNYVGNASRTQGEVKTWLEQLRDFMVQLPGAAPQSELTIASGLVTPTGTLHTIDTEGEAASDNLDGLNVTNLPAGSVVIISAADAARKVTVKHNAAVSPWLETLDGADYVLNDYAYSVFMRWIGRWKEVERGRPIGTSSSGAGLNKNNIAVLSARFSSGTDGGAIANNTWNHRPINTVEYDPGGLIKTLGSNVFTMKAGTYQFRAVTSSFRSSNTFLRLSSKPPGFSYSAVEWGFNTFEAVGNNAGGLQFMDTSIRAYEEDEEFKIEQWTENAQANTGMGISGGFGNDEVYLQLRVMRYQL